MPHLNNKQSKTINPNISRQYYHLSQPCRSEEKQTTNKQTKLSTNLTLYKPYTNHWTNLRRAETTKKKEFNLAAATAAKSRQSCLTLCDPIVGSPPGSPVPGILQARTLEWVAISFSNAWKWKWTQSCPTLSDPMDCSLPGSSVHGIFQARVLEWGAIAFSETKYSNWY